MSNPTETIREVQRELGDVLLDLEAPTTGTRSRVARVLDRCCEDLAEAAGELRQP